MCAMPGSLRSEIRRVNQKQRYAGQFPRLLLRPLSTGLQILPAGLQEKALRLLQEPDGDLELCLQRICSLCGFRADVAGMPPMFLLEAVDPC